jgi:hypothetical protein
MNEILLRLRGFDRITPIKGLLFPVNEDTYPLIFRKSHNTNAIISTTTITPIHIPALKMSPIASQLVRKKAEAKKSVVRIVLFLIFFIFYLN